MRSCSLLMTNGPVDGSLTEADFERGKQWLRKQDELREYLWQRLQRYPKSSLYDDELFASSEAHIETFQQLLRHIRETLKTSPRSRALDALSCKFQEAAESFPMADLYRELQLKKDSPAYLVAEAVANVKASPLYSQWQAASSASKKLGQIDVNKQKIVDGLTKKAISKGPGILSWSFMIFLLFLRDPFERCQSK